ncbi:Tigger transposable element-derived protein 1 [Cucumispora dikerogammari]|nr:Tigger transposable element-derived protein 1 [Cucumispora dikerogammari]
MSQENRKIALIMNNATSHFINSKMSNIDVIFLPKNITSLIQPCDQRIIKSFKDRFLKFITEYLIYDKNTSDNIDKRVKNITIFDANCITKMSRDNVSKDTIINCFQKALNIVSDGNTHAHVVSKI